MCMNDCIAQTIGKSRKQKKVTPTVSSFLGYWKSPSTTSKESDGDVVGYTGHEWVVHEEAIYKGIKLFHSENK